MDRFTIQFGQPGAGLSVGFLDECDDRDEPFVVHLADGAGLMVITFDPDVAFAVTFTEDRGFAIAFD